MAFLLALFLFFYSVSAATANDPGISITPPFATLNLAEASPSSTIIIENHSQVPQSLELQALTFSKTDLLGRVVFDESIEHVLNPPPNPALSLSTTRLDLNPGTRQEITALIDPSKLKSGGSYFLILAKATTPLENPGSNQVIYPSIASLLLVSNPNGATIALNLKPLPSLGMFLTKIPTSIDLTFSNAGNVYVIPHGTVTITDPFGRTVAQGPVNENSSFILPGSDRLLSSTLTQIRKPWPFMLYTLKVEGRIDDSPTRFGQSQSFIYLEPLTLGGIATAVFVIFLGVRFFTKTFRLRLKK